MSIAILRCNRDCPHNEGVDEKVKEELAELEAIALRVVRRNALNDRDEEEIRKRLPSLRAQDVGPADLERTIHSVFVAGSISRWTKDYAPAHRRKRSQPPAVGES